MPHGRVWGQGRGALTPGPWADVLAPGNMTGAHELHVSVEHLCGFQPCTLEVKPPNPGSLRCGGQPCALTVSETDLPGLCLLMKWEKSYPPSRISVDFRNFTGIFLLIHFLLVLPSSRTFFNGRALKFHVSCAYVKALLFQQKWTEVLPPGVYCRVFAQLCNFIKVMFIFVSVFNLLESCWDKCNLYFNLYLLLLFYIHLFLPSP